MLLVLLAAVRAGAEPTPADLEAELALARRPDLYVVVDPGRSTVEIKIRGKAFATLPMAGWGFFVYRSGPGPEPPAEVKLPAVFRVTGDPAAASRPVETVAALRPYAEDLEGSSPAPPPPAPPRPAAFEVPLESGWVLRAGPELPPTRGWDAWKARVADGWASLRGRPPTRPPLLAIALDADGAGRLHHVLRPGTAVLVASPAVD